MARREAGARRPVAAVAGGAEEEAAGGLGETDAAMSGRATRIGFAPIVRVDGLRREVEMCATSEAVDSYGTIFDYAASKDAFTRWVGNVREMHERRAVGQRVSVRCDDTARQVHVRVRISRGAEDTWQKVLDGTLRGASIGASNVVWQRQTRTVACQERQVNVATRYDLVELSLVDNPSNPDALGVAIVRDAVPDVAMLDTLEPGLAQLTLPPAEGAGEGYRPLVEPLLRLPQREQPPAQPDVLFAEETGWGPRADVLEGGMAQIQAQADALAQADVLAEVRSTARGERTRVVEQGAGIAGAGTQGSARERLHVAARAVMRGCGCALCQGACAYLAPVGRKDAVRGADDGAGTRDAARDAALERALAAGLDASAARLERVDASVRGLAAALQAAMGEMTSAVGTLLARVERIEAQPLPGGPAARPVEKRHALGPAALPGPVSAAEQVRALEALAGRLSDPQAQIAVAAEMIRLQQGG